MTEKTAWVWLSRTPGLSIQEFHALIERFGTASAVWAADEHEWAGVGALRATAVAALRVAREKEGPESEACQALRMQLKGLGVFCVCAYEPEYPIELWQLSEPPPVLYGLSGGGRARGIELLGQTRKVTVVGTRRCSRYGEQKAQELGYDLAAAGVTVVSGLALGVDGAAHMGALAAKGLTIAVVACGPEEVYPPENAALRERIIAEGLVITECLPNTAPAPGRFPVRNRIMAALSEGVVVVEGRKKSGASITARQALEQNKNLFAVPGQTTMPTAELPNRLLRAREAFLTFGAEDVLEGCGWLENGRSELELLADPSRDGGWEKRPDIPDEGKTVLREIERGDVRQEELERITGLPSRQMASLLTFLEFQGIIRQLPGRLFTMEHPGRSKRL